MAEPEVARVVKRKSRESQLEKRLVLTVEVNNRRWMMSVRLSRKVLVLERWVTKQESRSEMWRNNHTINHDHCRNGWLKLGTGLARDEVSPVGAAGYSSLDSRCLS